MPGGVGGKACEGYPIPILASSSNGDFKVYSIVTSSTESPIVFNVWFESTSFRVSTGEDQFALLRHLKRSLCTEPAL
jgi:hypothetical protein